MVTPVSLRRLPVTQRGQAELRADLAWLGGLRREIIAERAQGLGLAGRQPAEWGRLGHELAAVDEQILRLRCDLATALLIADDDPRVAVGCEVTVGDEWGQETYTIVGPGAADPGRRRLAYDSPLARAVLGREVGEEVEVADPAGPRLLRIAGVRTLPGPRLPAWRPALSAVVA